MVKWHALIPGLTLNIEYCNFSNDLDGYLRSTKVGEDKSKTEVSQTQEGTSKTEA